MSPWSHFTTSSSLGAKWADSFMTIAAVSNVRFLDRLLLATGDSLVSTRAAHGACTLSEYYCSTQERTHKGMYQIPNHKRLLTFLSLFPESNHPWSWIPANWLMAPWAVAFSFQAFTACSVMIGVTVILLAYVNLRVMLYHPAAWTSPIDYLFLHAPIVSRAPGASCGHFLTCI